MRCGQRSGTLPLNGNTAVFVMLQIILLQAWLNLQYPRLAVPIRRLIDTLLDEQQRGELSSSYLSHEERYRIAFGLPFMSKA